MENPFAEHKENHFDYEAEDAGYVESPEMPPESSCRASVSDAVAPYPEIGHYEIDESRDFKGYGRSHPVFSPVVEILPESAVRMSGGGKLKGVTYKPQYPCVHDSPHGPAHNELSPFPEGQKRIFAHSCSILESSRQMSLEDQSRIALFPP